jgi:hypothetical protein
MHSDPLGRENYVRLICNGYLVLGKPIPPEFWDEWEALCAKQAPPTSAEDLLLQLPPEPMAVFAVMHDESEFLLTPAGPSKDGHITLTGTVLHTGFFKFFRLQRPDGTILAQFDGNIPNVALVQGDSLHCTLDAEAMVKLLLT